MSLSHIRFNISYRFFHQIVRLFPEWHLKNENSSKMEDKFYFLSAIIKLLKNKNHCMHEKK